MTGLVLICKPDGTRELVERELPELTPDEPEETDIETEILMTLIDQEIRISTLELGL